MEKHISPGIYTKITDIHRKEQPKIIQKDVIQKFNIDNDDSGNMNIKGRLVFTARARNSVLGLAKLSSHQLLWYSTDNVHWNKMDTNTTVNVAIGTHIYVIGFLLDNNSETDYTQFRLVNNSSSFEISGSCNAIWNYKSINFTLLNYCGYCLFKDCKNIIPTSNFKLEATNLSENCYNSMFQNCTGLTTAPVLAATTLSKGCYENMFSGCNHLTTAPVLPATILVDNCYKNMFYGCSNLTTAPELPAVTLSDSCYYQMFRECTKLTYVPELPAITLAHLCYYAMFYNCNSLINGPKILPAMELLSDGYIEHPASNGDGASQANNRYTCYSFMFEKCTKLKKAPILPAKQLTTAAYAGMFRGCTNLETLYILADNIFVTGLANDYLNKNASTLWLFQNGNLYHLKIFVPPGLKTQWNQLTTYYTNVYNYNVIELTQEEIDEIRQIYGVK